MDAARPEIVAAGRDTVVGVDHAPEEPARYDTRYDVADGTAAHASETDELVCVLVTPLGAAGGELPAMAAAYPCVTRAAPSVLQFAWT